MMSVLEYAQDVNKTVEEILRISAGLELDILSEYDVLDEYMITELDNAIMNNIEDIDDKVVESESDIEEIIGKEVKVDTLKSTNKKPNVTFNKKDFANKKKEMYKNKEKLISNEHKADNNDALFNDNMTIAEFAKELNVSVADLIKKLFLLGIVTNANTAISYEQAELLALDYNKTIKRSEVTDITNFEDYEVVDKEEDLTSRAPVVTIMGHVDHGKTTLLDTIRKASVASGEAGGITQAISAYQVKYNGKPITFIDTPGHAAFTEMRSRGAKITDIIIIMVAADDGVMPQTREAIDHAKEANVPIIVAINKIDKPGINLDKVMNDLSECGLMPEAWGGDTLFVNISALNNIGIDELLENILLISELQNYRANFNRYALGTVIESRLDKNLGPTTIVLIQNGTLRLGDPIAIGTTYGKIRTMRNDLGVEIFEAPTSLPVEITGLNELPNAGDRFVAFEAEKQAKAIAEVRKNQSKNNIVVEQAVSLDDLFNRIKDGIKEVKLVIKTDVNGSAEALKNALSTIDVDGVAIKVIRTGVGAITESDVILAHAGNAIIIGFNVKVDNTIKDSAKDKKVEIRQYDVIYKAVEDLENAMKGMLDPIFEEKVLGQALVRQLFKFSKVGIIAGSYVTDGIIKNNAKARIIRAGKVIFDGNIGSIQREKDTVREVKKGFECGITIDKFDDIKEEDIIEAYEIVEVKP